MRPWLRSLIRRLKGDCIYCGAPIAHYPKTTYIPLDDVEIDCACGTPNCPHLRCYHCAVDRSRCHACNKLIAYSKAYGMGGRER